jgi:hypothetical protein
MPENFRAGLGRSTFIAGINKFQNDATFNTCLNSSLEILTKMTCLEFYLKPE